MDDSQDNSLKMRGQAENAEAAENRKLFHKDFSLVVIGQIISLFGNGIIRFALPLYLLMETGSATLFGMVSALSFLPMVVLSPIGGMIADRVNKRDVMVVLDFLTAGLMLVFFLLLGKVDLVLLLVLTLMILFGIQGAYQPTVQASMPLLHGRKNLLRANAVINQVNSLAGLLAPVLGGILFSFWGLKPIIIIGGGCFFFSAVMEIFIKIPHQKVAGHQNIIETVKQDFSGSLSFMTRQKPIILKVMGVIFSLNLVLAAMVMVAMPVLIIQVLGMNEQFLGYAQGGMAAGGLGGGLLAGVLAPKLRMKNMYLFLLAAAAVLLPVGFALGLGLSLFGCYLVICVCCFSLMAICTVVSVQLLSFVQGETPVHMVGKVLSMIMALSISAQPLGQAIYGFLFDLFIAAPYWIIFGAAVLAGSISLWSKRVFAKIE